MGYCWRLRRGWGYIFVVGVFALVAWWWVVAEGGFVVWLQGVCRRVDPGLWL